jgi:hypothetical protein
LEKREILIGNRISKLKRDNEKCERQIKVSENKFTRLSEIHARKQ